MIINEVGCMQHHYVCSKNRGVKINIAYMREDPKISGKVKIFI
jgi:hypothetical protein